MAVLTLIGCLQSGYYLGDWGIGDSAQQLVIECPVRSTVYFEYQPMGSGCFSPGQTAGEIDITALDAYYEEVRNMGHQPLSLDSQIRQAYSSLKQKTIKKGTLKKMCDFLSSHRFRICGNLLHNHRIISQSKLPSIKIAAIIVLEHILAMAPSSLHCFHRPHNSLNSLRSLHEGNTNLLNRVGQSENEANRTRSTRNIKTENSEAVRSNKAINSVLQEMTSFKFEEIYMNIICLLIKEGGEIYNLTLSNLVTYCSLSPNRFNNTEQTEEIMRTISYHIQSKDYLYSSLEAFGVMLTRVRENFYRSNLDFAKNFIELWEQCQMLQGPNSEGLDQEKVFEAIKIGNLCHDIIFEYLHSCIDSSQWISIYHALLQLIDSRQFANSHQIEELIFEMVPDLELKEQFCKGLFIHLLSYVALPQSSELTQAWYDTYNDGNISQFRVKYKKIEDPLTRMNALAKISEWLLQLNIVEPADLFTYSCNSLVSAYTFNLSSSHHGVRDKAASCLLQLADRIKPEYRTTLTDCLLSQVSDDLFGENERYRLICIAETLISKEESLRLQQKHTHFILPLSVAFEFQTNLKIIQLTRATLLRLTPGSMETILYPICDFFLSVSKQVATGYSNSKQKVMLIDQAAKLMQALPSVRYAGILQAYCERLSEQFGRENVPEQDITIFFSDLLTYEVASIVSPISIPTSLKKQLETVKARVSLKDEKGAIKSLEEYSLNRTSHELQLCFQKSKGEVNLYQESRVYLQNRVSKENELLVSASIFGKGRSVLSIGSINGKDDVEIGEVLDILRR